MTGEPKRDIPTDWPPGVRRAVASVRPDELIEEWLADKSGEQESSWELLKGALNETRGELGQAPVRE